MTNPEKEQHIQAALYNNSQAMLQEGLKDHHGRTLEAIAQMRVGHTLDQLKHFDEIAHPEAHVVALYLKEGELDRDNHGEGFYLATIAGEGTIRLESPMLVLSKDKEGNLVQPLFDPESDEAPFTQSMVEAVVRHAQELEQAGYKPHYFPEDLAFDPFFEEL